MKMSNLKPKEIINILEKNKNELKRYSVKRIGLFGSFAKHMQNKNSDLDFLVTFNEMNYDNYIELKFLLQKLFKRRVDVVIERSLKPALRYVKREALYAKRL